MKTRNIDLEKMRLKNWIIDMLKKGNNQSVYSISRELNIEPNRAFRKHLLKLKQDDILKFKKENRIKLYS